MLRVVDGGSAATPPAPFLSVDKKRKQVTLQDPGAADATSSGDAGRRVGVAAPKMFAFDGLFTQQDSHVNSKLIIIIHWLMARRGLI